MSSSKNFLSKLLVLITLLMLASCKVELFSDMDEKEINEMVAILLDNGLDASKVSGKKNLASLYIAESDMALAVRLLDENGYPRQNFQTLGDVFSKDGIISSPLEEKARYVYAVSQELSETLSNLDGVITARVHLVLPETDNTGEISTPSSASVFLKYQEGLNMDGIVPQIKLLVNNSVEGLDYGRISVVLFPTRPFRPDNTDRLVKVLFFTTTPQAASILYIVFSLLLIVVVAVAGYAGFRVFQSRRES